MEVVDNVRVEDNGQDEPNVEFTKDDNELDEFKDNNVKDIDFEDNANDRDDGDYFELNVNLFVPKHAFVTEDKPYEAPKFSTD